MTTPPCRTFEVEEQTFPLGLVLTLYGVPKYGTVLYYNLETPTERTYKIVAETRTYTVPYCTDDD